MPVVRLVSLGDEDESAPSMGYLALVAGCVSNWVTGSSSLRENRHEHIIEGACCRGD